MFDVRTAALAAASAVVGAVIVVGLVTKRPGPLEPLPQAGEASANHLAHMLVASIEHEMVDGDALDTAAMLERIGRKLTDVDIHVYDHRGLEVFGGDARAPHPRDMEPLLVATLTDGQRRVAAGGTIYRPIVTADACRECHTDGAGLRGVVVLDASATACDDGRVQKLVAEHLADQPCDVEAAIDAAFIDHMAERRGRLTVDYFDDLGATDAITRVQLFDNAGRPYFDSAYPEPPPELLAPLTRAQRESRVVDGGARHQVVLPMLQQESCGPCHGNEQAVRGAVAVTVATPAVEGDRRSVFGGADRIAIPAAAAGILLVCAAVLLVRRRRDSAPPPSGPESA